MSRPMRLARWVWPMLAVASVMALVFGIQHYSAKPSSVAAASAGNDRGKAALHSSDLAALARRARALQDQLRAMQEQLTTVQTETALAREHAAAIDTMLANDTLTQSPVFLQDETTVRALQGIIREAVGSDPTGKGTDSDRLGTAAAIARERLRQKLEALRDGLKQQASRLESQADDLRDRIRNQSAEMESLQAQITRQLQAQPATGGLPPS